MSDFEIPTRFGASEEKIKEWEAAGMINASPLPEGARILTPEDRQHIKHNRAPLPQAIVDKLIEDANQAQE